MNQSTHEEQLAWHKANGLDPAYPTTEQVMSAIETLSRTQLGYWERHLPSPGSGAAGTPKFEKAMKVESLILELIRVGFKMLGGWTPAVSKAVGWGAR